MKLKVLTKIFLRNLGRIFLLTIALFACTASPEFPQSPVIKPTKTKTSPAPSIPENDEPSTKTFSLQNANKIAPADVLEEVSFGGRGAGDVCQSGDFSYPSIDNAWTTVEAEWLASINVVICGWWSDNEVSVTVNMPNGGTVTDIAEVKQTKSGIPYTYYNYMPHPDSPSGIYGFSFNGKSGFVEHSVNVTLPTDPRMYYLTTIQSFYLYGFFPNERIRFFLYGTPGSDGYTKFTAWDEFDVDSNGHLIIKADIEEGNYLVIGDTSGPLGFAKYIQDDSSPSESQSSSKSCSGALPSRLEIGKYAYVSTDPPLDNRVREEAGTNHEIIGYIGTGNAMKILDGPKCADGWAWWKVQSIKKSDLVGWTSEGDDVYWLIPCDSLSSCP